MTFNPKHVARHPLTCAGILLALTLTACTSSEMTKAEKLAPRQVDFSTPDLADSIAIGKIDRTFDSSSIMHLNVPLKATTGLDLSVDYRITYFDENRSPIDVPTAWQTKSLTPGIWESVQATSASPRAKDFQIDFRWTQ